MIRGLYIAASSAISEAKRVDVIANNIANVNTAGYKKDLMITESFPEILISKINGIPDKDVLRQRSQGNGITTENNGGLYNASTGSGFFNVETPQGISRSKSIQFKINEEGYMVTPQGNYILGQNGRINTGGEPVSIDNMGRVTAGGTVLDNLKISNPINSIGNLSYGIRSSEVKTNFEQGQVYSTGNSFDLALRGKGFFCVETPEGERYTRDGEFTKDSQGYLVTSEGYKVLGENGYIMVEGKEMTVNEKGEVYKDDEMVGKLKIVDFNDYNALRKEGGGLIGIAEGVDEQPQIAAGDIQQGFLESSNVNSVKEMVEMLTMLRSYEASQKVIKIHDELLGKSVNEIARV
ncbi:MAG: flagellar hook-basal body protein [Caulobacteraceae bacterium]